MDNVFIEETKSSPKIILNADENTLIIKGQSYPENAVNFFKPIFNWIEEYLETVDCEVILKLNLLYLNTSSSKCIMDLIDIFNEAYNNSKNVKIHWYYHPENSAMKECGEEFKEDQDIPFEIIESEEI